MAMVAAAWGAFHSHSARHHFIEAALLSEAYALTAPIKLRMADYYVRKGVMPNSNVEAGLPAPQRNFGAHVKRITVNPGGVLRVDFDDEIGKAAMVFEPKASHGSSYFSWHCSSDSLHPAVLEKLRPVCRSQPPTPEVILMEAIVSKDWQQLNAMIHQEINWNADINGTTPLQLAEKFGHSDVADFLVDQGATELKIRNRGDNGAPSLGAALRDLHHVKFAQNHAVHSCDGLMVPHLLPENSSIDIEEANKQKHSDFELSALLGCVDVLDEMIQAQAPDYSSNPYLLIDVIRSLSHKNLYRVVQTLVQFGFDVNTKSPLGETALMVSIAAAETEIAKYLIDQGADVNERSATGSYPIIEASKKGLLGLVSELRAAGAHIDSADALGQTALFAAVAQANLPLVDRLLEFGANPHKRDVNGISARILAQSSNQRRIPALLTATAQNEQKR